MHRKLSALLTGLVLGLVVACGGGEEAAEQQRQAERDAQWAELEKEKAALDEKRGRLEELRMQARTAAESAEAEAAQGADAVAAEVETLEQEIVDESQAFYERLIEHINSAEIVEGAELTERQLAAIRMKSSEDIMVAREYIDQGGDYARAIDIYQTAMVADPDNPELAQALAEAEANRWMTEERFGQLKKGMTRDEVRQVVGPPNLHNIQEYPDKKTIAWFYPKGPDRSAAGVYFSQRGNQPYKVYLIDFNAVKAPAQGG